MSNFSGSHQVSTSPKAKIAQRLRHYEEMEILTILWVDNLTCLANVTTEHFFRVAFL